MRFFLSYGEEKCKCRLKAMKNVEKSIIDAILED